MSIYQIEAKVGHRVEEHIFVLFSILELYKKKNIPLILNTFHISRYFDRHTVQVKTALGMTNMALTGGNLGQGSRSAAVVCSMSLSKSVDKHYSDSKHEVS